MANEERGASEVSDDTRELGIEFGQLQETLNDHDYPASGAELIAAYGDFELELPGGTQTFEAILGKRRSEGDADDDLQYESAEAVHEAIHNMVGSEAVGRVGYTDRGGSVVASEGGPGEQESM